MSFGFTFFPADDPAAEVPSTVLWVASTEEAKRLAGRDEAKEALGGSDFVLFSRLLFSSAAAAAGISKMARHTGHLKGALPV